MSLAATSCSGSHAARAAEPSTTTLPAGTVTRDVWDPPPLTGGPSQAEFCAGLTALYGHMAELAHVVSPHLTERFLADYVAFEPKLLSAAPAGIASAAGTYLGTVAAYLQKLSAAGLQLGRLPSGALAELSTPSVDSAFEQLSGYSTTNCHYTIGGNLDG